MWNIVTKEVPVLYTDIQPSGPLRALPRRYKFCDSFTLLWSAHNRSGLWAFQGHFSEENVRWNSRSSQVSVMAERNETRLATSVSAVFRMDITQYSACHRNFITRSVFPQHPTAWGAFYDLMACRWYWCVCVFCPLPSTHFPLITRTPKASWCFVQVWCPVYLCVASSLINIG